MIHWVWFLFPTALCLVFLADGLTWRRMADMNSKAVRETHADYMKLSDEHLALLKKYTRKLRAETERLQKL